MELLYRIWLAQKYKVRKKKACEMIKITGSAENVYNLSDDEYINFGCNEKEIEQLNEKNLDEAGCIINDCEKLDIKILTPLSDEFPKILCDIKEPVQVLYIKGEIPDWNNILKIAIVGTRHNSEYAGVVTSRFSSELADKGAVIVSGMAMGIDCIAMNEALKSEGFVIGVMGRGLDEAYPKQNSELFEELTEKGCAISEYPPGEGANRMHFPQRNRIVCALSDGVLAVEAPLKSGTLITARYAREMNKPLFAVPGNIYNRYNEGTNQLLRTGATAVTSVNDILEEFPYKYNSIKRTRVSEKTDDITEVSNEDLWIDDPLDDRIIKLLKKRDMNIEEIAAECDVRINELNSHLTILEVEGIILKLAGARYKYNTEN